MGIYVLHRFQFFLPKYFDAKQGCVYIFTESAYRPIQSGSRHVQILCCSCSCSCSFFWPFIPPVLKARLPGDRASFVIHGHRLLLLLLLFLLLLLLRLPLPLPLPPFCFLFFLLLAHSPSFCMVHNCIHNCNNRFFLFKC